MIKDQNGKFKVIAAGGYRMKSSEIFDIESRKWTNGPDLPNVIYHGESVQYKNTFLIVGGWDGSNRFDSIYEYDIRTNQWIKRSEKLKRARLAFTAFLVPDEVAQCN